MTTARWLQKLTSYKKALARLEEALAEHQRVPNDFIKESVVQRFEYTHELAWKTLKSLLEYEGYEDVIGSRSATRQAFNSGIIQQGEIWMEMIKTRNVTVHAYDEQILSNEFYKIAQQYLPELQYLAQRLDQLAQKAG